MSAEKYEKVSNAKHLQHIVRKQVEEVLDYEPTDHWSWHSGFTIVFTDGTKLNVSADTGQGAGYVIVGDEDES